MYYAGIGARKTPPGILELMADVAEALASVGWILSSGGQEEGADNAFESGCDRIGGKKRICLPWQGFCGRHSTCYEPNYEAMLIAARYHSRWGGLSQGVQKLFGRNVHVVLGPHLVPEEYVKFVLCWTEGGQVVGGTGHAIQVANSRGITDIWNMADPDVVARVKSWIAQYRAKQGR